MARKKAKRPDLHDQENGECSGPQDLEAEEPLLSRAWEFLADVSVRNYFSDDPTYQKLLKDLEKALGYC